MSIRKHEFKIECPPIRKQYEFLNLDPFLLSDMSNRRDLALLQIIQKKHYICVQVKNIIDLLH